MWTLEDFYNLKKHAEWNKFFHWVDLMYADDEEFPDEDFCHEDYDKVIALRIDANIAKIVDKFFVSDLQSWNNIKVEKVLKSENNWESVEKCHHWIICWCVPCEC